MQEKVGVQMGGCPVDYDKFKACFKKRGLAMSVAAREIGRTSTYLVHAKEQGYVTKSTALMLDRFFNIKPEDYAPDKPTLAEIEKIINKEPEATFDYDKLNDVIQAAVKAGVKEAVKEIEQTLYKDMYHASYQAFKKGMNE